MSNHSSPSTGLAISSLGIVRRTSASLGLEVRRSLWPHCIESSGGRVIGNYEEFVAVLGSLFGPVNYAKSPMRELCG